MALGRRRLARLSARTWSRRLQAPLCWPSAWAATCLAAVVATAAVAGLITGGLKHRPVLSAVAWLAAAMIVMLASWGLLLGFVADPGASRGALLNCAAISSLATTICLPLAAGRRSVVWPLASRRRDLDRASWPAAWWCLGLPAGLECRRPAARSLCHVRSVAAVHRPARGDVCSPSRVGCAGSVVRQRDWIAAPEARRELALARGGACRTSPSSSFNWP